MNLSNYSSRSFVLFGDDTKIYKGSIKGLGGKWNHNLTNPITGERFGGWIFSNEKLNDVTKEFGVLLLEKTSLSEPIVVSESTEASLSSFEDEEFQTNDVKPRSHLISNMAFLCFVFMLCYVVG